MRIRTILAATALAGAATLTLAGSAFAVDRDCRDFTSHADAQAAFDAVPGDPEGLDPDGDGKACEDQFVDDLIGGSGEPGHDTGDSGDNGGDSGGDNGGDGGPDDGDAPVGGVATGGGGTAEGGGSAAPFAAAGASALAIGVLAAAGRRSTRRRG
ncbi:excalibur calcium-binding protein [Pseudonocardia kunmingensis]|uniref:Excalibur calcium-binding domain-containing protein n=1 Tax=Pseudonocardia kunmingensis TaxID=630975 RepID=A0A543DLI2_9PSEU|nr:excalibur calcium-binding protein [Pseudonocardia kunmingensis]TQM10179.1 excalibur calcium-binding domain-containing protein [Pseudonocardia kunmingensis]